MGGPSAGAPAVLEGLTGSVAAPPSFPGASFFGRGAEAGRDADGFALKYWMAPDAGDRDTIHDDRGTEGGKMGTISSTHIRHKYLRPVTKKVLGGYFGQQLWDVVEHLFFLVVPPVEGPP